MDFDWDDSNVEHIARHGVEPYEVEEVVADPRRVRFGAHEGPNGEPRRGFIGKTEVGRVLVVVLERRGERFRVVTARDADRGEGRSYRR